MRVYIILLIIIGIWENVIPAAVGALWNVALDRKMIGTVENRENQNHLDDCIVVKG